MKKSIAAALTATLLAACGGGGSGSVPAPPSNGGSGTLALTLKVPGAKNVQVRALRHPLYTSRDTKGIGVDFRLAAGGYTGAPAVTPTYAAAITAGSGGCGTPISDGSFTCTIYVPGVPVGYEDLRVSLWNIAPTGGAFTGGRVLSTNSFPSQAIKSGQNNTFNFTLLPVVDSVQIVPVTGIVDGTSSSLTVYLAPKDATGDLILTGDQYVDSNFNAISLNAAILHNISASLTLTPASPSFSNGGTVNSFTVAYDGLQQFPSTGATQPAIAVNITGGAIAGSIFGGALSVTQTGGPVVVPSVPQIANVSALTQGPSSVALDSTGNLWFAEGTKIDKYVLPAGPLTSFTTPFSGIAAQIIAGNDGYMWYTDVSANEAVVKFSPATGPSGAQTVKSATLAGAPSVTGLAFGPDGNVYISDAGNNKIDSVSPTNMGVVTPYGGLTATSNVSLMSAGPPLGPTNDGTVCFIEPDTIQGKVGCFDTNPANFGVATQANTGAIPHSIALGPDGLLYVGETGRIESFDVSSGALTVTTATGPYFLASATAQVTGMAVGRDNNMWFVEQNAPAPTVGRVNLQASVAHTVQEWSTGTNATFEGAGRSPTGIVLSPGSTFQMLFSDDQPGAANLWSVTP